MGKLGVPLNNVFTPIVTRFHYILRGKMKCTLYCFINAQYDPIIYILWGMLGLPYIDMFKDISSSMLLVNKLQ